MHSKTFTKLCYHSKIITGLVTADDVSATFRNIVRHYKTGQIGVKEGSKYAQFIDYNLFKRALIRLGLVAQESQEQAVIGDDMVALT